MKLIVYIKSKLLWEANINKCLLRSWQHYYENGNSEIFQPLYHRCAIEREYGLETSTSIDSRSDEKPAKMMTRVKTCTGEPSETSAIE